MYSLLLRIPDGLEPLRAKFEEHVKASGLSAVSKIIPEDGVDSLVRSLVHTEIVRNNPGLQCRSLRFTLMLYWRYIKRTPILLTGASGGKLVSLLVLIEFVLPTLHVWLPL